jgi:hypothetical protein
MSWSSGSRLFAGIAEIIADTISDENERKLLYKGMIAEFESFDCDNLFECRDIDPVLDSVLDEIYEPVVVDDFDEEEEWPDGGREDF